MENQLTFHVRITLNHQWTVRQFPSFSASSPLYLLPLSGSMTSIQIVPVGGSTVASDGGNRLRVELLTEQTNCFITRGGHLLFLVSCRIYNEGDQIPVTIQRCKLQAKIGHRWQDTELYQAPHAVFFPSLLRNSLPILLKPEERQDFYEVFALDALIPSTTISIRLKFQSRHGKITLCRDKFSYRVDDHSVFDILFRVFERG